MKTSHVRTGVRILGLALAVLAIAVPSAAAVPPDVDVQLLGINDFHGNLEPPTGSVGRILPAPGQSEVQAGGAAFLASHIRALRATNPNSLVVSAGDLIGASPLLSAAFHDEPTIEAMNMIGLDLNAVGNHEFDEGEVELRRMQEGGCHPTDTAGTCADTDGRFDGANFQFLAANVVERDTGAPMFPAYAIKKFGNIKVGFIGMTLEGTPDIVSPSGIRNLQFLDEADTANRYARELREEHGVRAIVVLLHEGGTPSPFAGINACNVSNPIADIVNRTDDAVDLFVTGHTHQPYNCVIDGRPVTSASSFGRLVTDIDFQLDRQTKDIKNVSANNVIVTRTNGAMDIQALIDHYNVRVAPVRDRVIGSLTAPLTRTPDNSGEQAAGNAIADAQLFASRSEGAVAAFMNPGGVRTDIDAGPVTYGEAFAMQPFGNNLTTITLTGAQLYEMLKQQFCGPSNRRILLPSATVHYTWDPSLAPAPGTPTPCASAQTPVVPGSLTIDGIPVENATSYRITVNSFLADGGDSFPVLPTGTNRVGGVVDIDAFQQYLAANPNLAPPALNRIDVVNG
jgi:5'-nucleotidase